MFTNAACKFDDIPTRRRQTKGLGTKATHGQYTKSSLLSNPNSFGQSGKDLSINIRNLKSFYVLFHLFIYKHNGIDLCSQTPHANLTTFLQKDGKQKDWKQKQHMVNTLSPISYRIQIVLAKVVKISYGLRSSINTKE